MMLSRRKFLLTGGGAGMLSVLPAIALAESLSVNDSSGQSSAFQLIQRLDGQWGRCFDPTDKGVGEKWFIPANKGGPWNAVQIPHTWQIEPGRTDYFGTVWYKKKFYVPAEWQDKTVRVEFEAVYHTAHVWLNGKPVGKHIGKGYTAFMIDLSAAVQPGLDNTMVVRVSNAFDDDMLPRGHSFDWAADGGITRPVSLYVTDPAFTERVIVESEMDLDMNKATIAVMPVVANKNGGSVSLDVSYRIREDHAAVTVAQIASQRIKLKPGESKTLKLADSVINDPLLWHFDHPHLYVLELELWKDGKLIHTYSTTFGIRKIEVKDAGFYLNGERVWLMGVERMAGSNPDFGMAEPTSWIVDNHQDLRELNCVFTRVHWQQDRRVLDYCDRHGIFIQTEVPSWGPGTFAGMKDHPSDAIMQNGLEQLQEMIDRDRNHPCIFSWGLCNEIHGQHAAAYAFAANMLKTAKKLDPKRLCSYASNSLRNTPEKDVTRLMDFVEWNEYFESWRGGTIDDVGRVLGEIHKAFPEKPIVISEYGWCRCAPDRKIGDAKKVKILTTHDEVFRRYDYVSGLIFFCYNDYRTHVGDKGVGALRQRVHGVVDLYGARKASFDVLRRESSPVLSLNSWIDQGKLHIRLQTRSHIPAYILRGYRLRWRVYADQDIPLEEGSIPIEELRPGDRFSHLQKMLTSQPEKITVEVLRPTGLAVCTKTIRGI